MNGILAMLGGGAAQGFAGAVLGEVLVRVGADTAPLTKGLSQAEAQAKSTSAQMEGAAKKSSGVWKTLWVAAAATAITALAAFAVKGVSIASALGESINKVNNVFGESSEEVIEWAETNANALGQAKGQALDAAASFGTMFTNLGIANDEATEMSLTMVKLASDLGSFMDADPSEMLDRFRSGIAGEVEALRRFGINLSAVRVEQEAVNMGLIEVGGTMTEQQKIQARYSLLLKDSEVAADDFAETVGDSLPNQLRVLQATVTDTAGELGQHLLPVFLDGAKAFTTLVKAARPAIPVALELLKVFLLYKGIAFVAPLLTGIGRAMQAFSIGGASAAVTSLAGSFKGLTAALAGLNPVALAVTTLVMALPPLFRSATADFGKMAEEVGVSTDTMEAFRQELETLTDFDRWKGFFADPLAGMTDTRIKAAASAWSDYRAEALQAGASQASLNEAFHEHIDILDGSRGSIDRFLAAVESDLEPEIEAYQKKLEEATAAQEAMLKGVGSMAEVGQRAGRFLDGIGMHLDEITEGANDAAKAEQDMKGSFQQFADETLAEAAKAAEAWRESMSDSINFVDEKLQDLMGRKNLTAGAIAKGFEQAAQATKNFGQNLDTIMERGGRRAAGLVEELAASGPEGAKAAQVIANAHDKTFDRIIDGWNKSGGAADDAAGRLQRKMVGTLQDIRDLLQAIATSWGIKVNLQDGGTRSGLENIRGLLREVEGTHVVRLVYERGGNPNPGNGDADGALYPGMARGGFLARGPVLVGEGTYATRFGRGGELVLPLNASTLSRVAKAIHEHGPTRTGNTGSGVTVVVNGDVYGLNDFERKVERTLDKALARNA